MNIFLGIMRRDLLVALHGGGIGIPLTFFVLVAVLVPFGVGPDPETLGTVSAGAIWIGALLACLLSLDRLFQADLEDGSLDVLRTSSLSLEWVVLAKCAANWLTTGLPLAVAAPLIGLLHGTGPEQWGSLVTALLIGTPALTLLGATGAALSAGLRTSGLLIPILVVPLCVPVIIFGAGAATNGPAANDSLLLLTAILLAAMPLTPLATAAALRLND